MIDSSDLKKIYDSVSKQEPSSLPLNIEGKTYIRNFRPTERLILLGGGHIAEPLCRYASDLGFAVTVVDDRPVFANRARFSDASEILCNEYSKAVSQLNINSNDYVAVITRGHRYDADCLRMILSSGQLPKYLGMIGSKRRVISLLNMLEEEGYSRHDLEQIHAPIGIDINALTTKEISISIVAELIQHRRKNVNRHASETVLTIEDIDMALIRFLAKKDSLKALLLVYETSGSTPVKTGAMMAIDKNFKTVGTIGGGCGEDKVLRQAWCMIGSGQQCSVTIEMNNDIAAEEGMVCGGSMKVFVADIV